MVVYGHDSDDRHWPKRGYVLVAILIEDCSRGQQNAIDKEKARKMKTPARQLISAVAKGLGDVLFNWKNERCYLTSGD